MSGHTVESLERILEQGGDADDVLRAVVDTLAAEEEISWAGVFFLEEGSLVLGPQAGTPDEPRRRSAPVTYRGERVGELAIHGEVEQALLERVAALVAAHVLLGWDTGGDAWDP